MYFNSEFSDVSIKKFEDIKQWILNMNFLNIFK